MSAFQITFVVSLVLYVLWVFSVLILERRRENSLISWLLVFILFPFVGFALYLIFGRDMSKKKIFKLYQAEEELMEEISHGNSDAYSMEKPGLEHSLRDLAEVIEFTSKLSPTGLSFDNQIEVYTDGVLKFASLMKDIQEANEHVHILYFIYHDDILGREFRDLLINKAREGVKVRLLLDHFGSFTVSRGFFKDFKKAGGMVSFSFPLRPGNMQINNRNHRKIVVIDNRIAYIGGFNIGDEYLGRSKKSGYWRDTHLRIQGSAIHDLQVRFLLDWRNAGNNDAVIDATLFKKPVVAGKGVVQILSSGPDSLLEEIKLTYLEMISRAKQYIYFQTPYFVPDEAMVEALRIALIKGIDVRLMIPNKQDHAFVYWATYSYIGDLLPLGLKAYAYQNGFLHAKTMVVDGEISSIGSANFDKRSFKLSFECNAFVFGKETGQKMKSIFENDLIHCLEITQEIYDNRSLGVKIKEPISRIISPIL